MNNAKTSEAKMNLHLANLVLLVLATFLLILVCNLQPVHGQTIQTPLRENVVSKSNSQNDIQHLMGFEVVDCKTNDANSAAETQKRILATNMEQVFPQAIKREGGIASINFEALSALHISGTQELFKMVIRLNSENAMLMDDIQRLREENQMLKSDLELIKVALQLESNPIQLTLKN